MTEEQRRQPVSSAGRMQRDCDQAGAAGPTPERRRAIRRKRADLSWLRTLWLRPGFDAALVNLSTGGALVETPNRLRPGARTVLRLIGTSDSWTVSGSVSRAWVSSIAPEHGVVYRGALVFDEALDLSRTERTDKGTVPSGSNYPRRLLGDPTQHTNR